MIDSILNAVNDVMSSPWIYFAIFAVSAIDGFFPAVPSESIVITAGVFAASKGNPDLALIVVTAAVGAFVGDHISYTIGRVAGARLLARMRPGTKRKAAYDWAARALHERGGLILVVARYIPGGRTAITLTMGAIRYPLRSFSFFDAIAALSWAIYGTVIGYVGGRAFESDPIRGLILGLGIAIGITVIVELVRHLRQRSRRRSAAGLAAASGAPDPAVREASEISGSLGTLDTAASSTAEPAARPLPPKPASGGGSSPQ